MDEGEPVEVARNSWGVIRDHTGWRTLEVGWLEARRDMSDEGFKETLELLASAGERLRPRFMLVDGTDFHHQSGEGVMEWRAEQIVPRYNSAGVTRFAFLAPAGSPGTVEAGGTPPPGGGGHLPPPGGSGRPRGDPRAAGGAPPPAAGSRRPGGGARAPDARGRTVVEGG